MLKTTWGVVVLSFFLLQPPQAILDLLCDVVKRLPDVSGLACTVLSRLSLLKAALSFLSAMRGFTDLTVPQVHLRSWFC